MTEGRTEETIGGTYLIDAVHALYRTVFSVKCALFSGYYTILSVLFTYLRSYMCTYLTLCFVISRHRDRDRDRDRDGRDKRDRER
jgi:hypothetical protein